MALVAWIMMMLSALQIFLVFRAASSGGPNPQPVQGWMLVTHILVFMAHVALGGRVLQWW